MMVKLRFFFYLSLTLLLSLLGYWSYQLLSDPQHFPVLTVSVQGDYPHLSHGQLQALILPYARQGLFGFSARQLQNDLEQLPWVNTANIRRSWPATLVVEIAEKQPVAIWNHSALVTESGILFTPDKKTYPDHLPLLSGPENKVNVVLATFLHADDLLKSLQLKVQHCMLSERNSWSFILNNQLLVIVGKDDLWPRLQRFITLYPQVIGDRADKIDSVDLRYSNGIAVAWKNH